MVQSKDEIGLAAELWSPALKQRFETLFAVAARKSLRRWRQVPLVSAQVLVVDGSLPVPEAAVWMPCVVYVGAAPQGQQLGRTPQRWATCLETDFTLSDLIDMLDRAAVFLMDWRIRQQVATSQTLARALVDLQQQGASCMYRFQLSAWVALPAPWNRAECLRALAMLCRGPMDVPMLCEHSGMEPEAVTRLLMHPRLTGVLHCSLRPAADAEQSAPRTSSRNRSAASHGAPRHWVKKLASWIRRGGYA